MKKKKKERSKTSAIKWVVGKKKIIKKKNGCENKIPAGATTICANTRHRQGLEPNQQKAVDQSISNKPANQNPPMHLKSTNQ